MKVDIVVNSMLQQIDRNLQTQVVPALSFRPGELLRGKVMLSADDSRPQIRLDNGTLLDALPAGDVMLTPGSTVMLRVSGRVDGQLVMQLLEQEQSTAQAAATAKAGEEETPAGVALSSTPQGKAVIKAMEGMNLPLREETVRQALDIQAAFPGLEPEKAVFMAANKLPATQAQVNALNSLVDEGATTGGALMVLADILSAQALDTENLQLAEDYQNASPTAASPKSAEQPETAQPQPRNNSNVPLPAAQGHNGQAGTSTAGTGRTAGAQAFMAGRAAEPETAPVGRNSTNIAGWTNAEIEIPPREEAGISAKGPLLAHAETPAQAEGMLPSESNASPFAANTVNAADVPAQTVPAGSGNGMLRLQSLSFAALGLEVTEQYSTAITALDDSGAAGKAAALALDAPGLNGEEFNARLDAIVSALPRDDAPAAKEFIVKLAAGLKEYSVPAQNVSALPAGPHEGINGIVRQIADLFVKLGGEDQDSGAALAKAAAEQRTRIEHISSELGKAGAASPDANRQMSRVENHVRLVSYISQYAYRQIPVQMNDRNRTVEIYVLNRKGAGKKIKADSANILIALDTDNLGHIETLINVSNKSLRLRFGVEHPALVGFVGSFTSEIADAVQKAGFRLSDVRTEVTASRTTPLTVTGAVNETTGLPGKLDIKL